MGKIKPIPIGVEFYKQMIDDGYYYVDKTLLIRDLLDQKSIVTLFTRPRRFGKTLDQTMLRTFFEKEILPDGTVTDNSKYFDGKKVMAAGKEYIKHLGQYPVIFLSLKPAKQPTFEMAYGSLIDEIRKEYDRHSYILGSPGITEKVKERYNSVLNMETDKITYAKSIAFLSECLEKYHSQKVIILLDEYDVPLENAYFNGFYDEMVSFIRSLFESALKTNESLKMAVVTGCLRVSKESIFTGLNNLKIVSILDGDYAEYFGFTQKEVESFLEAYGLVGRADEVKEWYDGYLFGHVEVYNPWSVINYVSDTVYGNTEFPKPYWSNTSSNSIVRELIENADDRTKHELEELIAGGTIEKPVHEDITYGDIFENDDCEKASDIITAQLMETISFYDYREDYYHGFLAGLLKNNGRYVVKSNRESGLGGYDLILKTRRILKGCAILLEFKVADNVHGLEKGCREALQQIEDKHYENDVREEGYPSVKKYGICFYKKECLVMAGE